MKNIDFFIGILILVILIIGLAVFMTGGEEQVVPPEIGGQSILLNRD